MRGILVDETAKLYSEPNNQNLTLATLRKGDEFELGKVIRKKGEVWVEVTLPGGQIGYIVGATHIFEIKQVQLLNNQIDLREAPDETSRLIKTYPKNTVLTAIGVENVGAKGWVKVTDKSGNLGYVRGDAKIRVYQVPTKSGGKKLMITGGVFSVFAIAIFVYSSLQPQTGSNMSVLTVAVLAFGLMQVIQGFMQYRNAKKLENEK
jgi:hypothetical protein